LDYTLKQKDVVHSFIWKVRELILELRLVHVHNLIYLKYYKIIQLIVQLQPTNSAC